MLDAAKGAVELGLEWFTVFAFSTENWRRPHQEVRFLLSIIADDLLTRRRDELHDLGVRIRFAGRRDWRVPGWILRRMDETAELTRHNKAMTLTVAFNYGGRAEIVDAARALVAEGIKASQVDERALRKHFYLPEMPDPDLFIQDLGGVPHLQLPAVGDRLQRARLHGRALARLPPRAPARRRARVPAAGAPLRA